MECCQRVGLVPVPLNVYAGSCIGLKIIREMLSFHLDLLPDPASSATLESCACATQARGLVATELHPMCHRGGESGCLREGQTGAQHIAGLPTSASPPPSPARGPGTEPWLSGTRQTMPAHPAGRKRLIFGSHSFSTSMKGPVSPSTGAGGERDPRPRAEGQAGVRAAHTAPDHR